MKPASFDYAAPDSMEAALSLLAEHGGDAKLLAGGQSLIPLMNFRLTKPALLVDLNRLDELEYVRRDDRGLRFGAMTRQRRLERETVVAESVPLLAEAVPFIAHPQIRNRGTLGGSLAHADPAAELPAVAVALGGRFLLRSAEAERWVAAEDFYLGLMATDLAPQEMLVEIVLPELPPRSGWSFMEIARRHGDYAMVGVATVLTLDEGGACRQVRLVYLSVGDTPLVARQAARSLEGERPSPSVMAEAARIAAEKDVEPSGDIHASAEYKRHLVRVLTARALERSARRAAGGVEV